MKMNANNVVQAQAFPTKPTKIPVTSFGSFPAVGSMLGDFFCLGRLNTKVFINGALDLSDIKEITIAIDAVINKYRKRFVP